MVKIRELWRKRRSVMFAWLLSYSAVLIIPIIISLVIYSQASQALKSEIHRANDSLLKQMRYTIDNQLELMKRLNMEITWNDRLQNLMYSSKPAKEAPYIAYQLAQDMRLYKSSYASVDEFYVVWEQGDTVLRAGNIRDMDTAFRTIHDTGEITYGQWQETLAYPAASRFAVLPHRGSDPAEKSVAYITHLPKGLNGREAGTVVIMADAARFQAAIAGISGFSNGLLLILNQNNEVLLSNGETSELTPYMDGNRLISSDEGETELFYMHPLSPT